MTDELRLHNPFAPEKEYAPVRHTREPMTDPITRERVELLRDYAAFFRREGLAHPRLAELDAFADALAALLPPEA